MGKRNIVFLLNELRLELNNSFPELCPKCQKVETEQIG